MRKIERDMINAVLSGKNWRQDNTRVKHDGAIVKVYLHDNLIASANRATRTVTPIPATFSEWATRTTASRLRALGIDATIRNGLPHIDGVALS